MNKLAEVEKKALRSDLEEFGPGDTVKVYFRIYEGKKDKVQAFQGVCIKIKGSGPNRAFTLRKITQGVGIERIFPLHSPVIEKVEVLRYGKVRRAKLYYLREKVGKKRQVKERIVSKKKAKKPRRKRRVQETAEVTKTEAEASKTEKAAVGKKVEEKPKNKPAVEDPAKEDLDAKSESGPRGVEEG
ncbi:50S ribosomal protein L19 [candidate division WOR-3 bacterium]|uniref:Large ribosomal subunit protein bL19 n=1 Tax=candidate division WOR-3 bacterium TaxID=2052148 RepID=A0A9D5QBM6_UNCW3|nr:50S ribosomal protein L19 [candidate division WOR-3 bacterium]MBD3363763.1 50S ribosomal protein L19 [candidate division WOR-3 bacterium]